MFVYGLQTHNTDRARPYSSSFYRLSKFGGKCNCDITPYEKEKCKKDTFVFDGDNCINDALDFLLKFKGEERKFKKRIGENNLQLHAYNGSGFDTCIILNNLPCDEHIVDNIKNGIGIYSLGVLNGYM